MIIAVGKFYERALLGPHSVDLRLRREPDGSNIVGTVKVGSCMLILEKRLNADKQVWYRILSAEGIVGWSTLNAPSWVEAR